MFYYFYYLMTYNQSNAFLGIATVAHFDTLAIFYKRTIDKLPSIPVLSHYLKG